MRLPYFEGRNSPSFSNLSRNLRMVGMGQMAKVLCQLLSGELPLTINVRTNCRRACAFFRDIAPGQSVLAVFCSVGIRQQRDQLVIHIFNEIGQVRYHIHGSTDLRILPCQCVGVIVTSAALLRIPSQRDKQSRGMPVPHQIPQVYPSGHPAVAVKPGMQVDDVEVDERRFQRNVHGGLLVDKLHQASHMLRHHLSGKAGVLHFVTYGIHAVMPVFMAGQMLIPFR